ncbi:MAG: exodeoxyribonuclease VII small subunit [Kordiimonas sp.]|nr:exodeoxyribonuclease VII small subunit [Kordiimonas sp.]|tara:strand:+ start:706 stop:969 length:264 start_codon:yes stop_codon:yes gene_type:complete
MADEKQDTELMAEIAQLSFEEALERLDDIVEKLEGGDVSLEESIDIYSQGTLLKKHCESKLQAAREKIEKITLDEDGGVSTQPLDVS